MTRSRAKSAPVQLLRVNGLPAPVEVRRHPTARRLTLRVSHTARSVVLTMPRNTDFREADKFLAKSLDWVRQRLEGVLDAVPFAHGSIIPLRGEPHEVVFATRQPGRPVVEIVTGGAGQPPQMVVNGGGEHAPRRLADWLVAQAKRDLDERVAHHAAVLKLKARQVRLRDQKSRWGSCTSDGHLSFSWRLVLAPPIVLDYVAAHEVAHLAEMNHGPRFWRLVKETMPRMDEAKLWLRTKGMHLYRYGA
ncbi:MAG: SprT family zinc-dependent metalloprotease [Hyphomicrobiaceae bacterium]|nr:SprT family zinc-dependent metalloprotease [Hyphomicrobiaceae bacterium]